MSSMLAHLWHSNSTDVRYAGTASDLLNTPYISLINFPFLSPVRKCFIDLTFHQILHQNLLANCTALVVANPNSVTYGFYSTSSCTLRWAWWHFTTKSWWISLEPLERGSTQVVLSTQILDSCTSSWFLLILFCKSHPVPPESNICVL